MYFVTRDTRSYAESHVNVNTGDGMWSRDADVLVVQSAWRDWRILTGDAPPSSFRLETED